MEWGGADPGTAMRIYIIPLWSFCQFDLNLEAQKAQLEGLEWSNIGGNSKHAL